MSANPIWIAGYFGPVAGASPVWIAPGDGTVPSAVQSQIVNYYAPVAGATAVWIAGFFAPPPAAIGATPIIISGWGGSGGGGPPPVTSVWSAADATANAMTLSNGGLTVAPGTIPAWTSIRSSISKTSGKLYVEFLNTHVVSLGQFILGLASSGISLTVPLGQSNYSVGLALNGAGTLASTGFTSNYSSPHVVPAINDVWALAIDFTTGNIWLAQNNVWFNSSNPATGALPIVSFTPATVGALFAALSFNDTNTLFGDVAPQPAAAGDISGVWTLQSTAASQKYAPPSGFKAWDAP
jgi:hypothetical protein